MIHLHTLDNGIRIVTEPIENYRSAAFGLWIDAGSADETKENNGIAHVIEHMLFKGTKTKTARQLADEITSIGGNLDAYTTRDYTCFSAHTLAIHLHHAIDIIADMVKNSLILEEDLQKELGVILEEIDMYEDDPEELISDLMHQAVWRNQPMGFLISGKKEVVRKFTRRDVLNFMDEYYVGTHMVISVAGRFNEPEILDVIKKAFGSIPPVKGIASNVDDENTKESLTVDFKAETKAAACAAPVYYQSKVFKQKQLEQMHLSLAFPCIPYDHKDQYVYHIVDSIIGSNQNSRLFQEIREDQGLTYAIYSYSSSFKKCGIFQIYAATNPAQLFQVLNEIKGVFQRLIDHPVTEKELTLTKAQIETELMIAAESTQSRMESNGDALIYHSKIDTLDKILKDIDNISLEDVHQFIKSYILDVMPSICVVGDLTQVNIQAVEKWRLYE